MSSLRLSIDNLRRRNHQKEEKIYNYTYCKLIVDVRTEQRGNDTQTSDTYMDCIYLSNHIYCINETSKYFHKSFV
jgi:hypothetical protein